MVKKLAVRYVSMQIERGILAESDRDLYQYAYEILLNQCLTISLTLLIAVIFSVWIPTLAFLAFYMPLRTNAGGYHADTNEKCLLVSALLVGIVCCLWSVFHRSQTIVFQMIAFAASGISLFHLAPVAHINKPLEEAEEVRAKQKSRLLWIFQLMIWLLSLKLYPVVSIAMGLSHFLFAVMLWAGAVQLKMDLRKAELENTAG